MDILGLDISTKTGWSLLSKDGSLKAYGVIKFDQKVEDFGEYPYNFANFADCMAKRIRDELLIPLKPTIVVIEETNKGKRTL
jgi:hypothetical protein